MRKLVMTALVMCASVIFAPAHALEEMHSHAHHDHMHHEISLSTVAYTTPDVKLIRNDGKHITLTNELDDGRPVVMSFIYTDCTAICPLISRILSQFQDKIGPQQNRVHLVSISIDPEWDTPARLTEYAQRYGAGPAWQHYTGTIAASTTVQRAFDVYHGDKMNHTPVFFLRKAGGEDWLRIDGFVTAEELFEKYQELNH